MKLIVGLGNPGPRYGRTRHNIGFMAVEAMAQEAGLAITKTGFSSCWSKGRWEGEEVLFLLPQTFMNLAGRAVREVQSFYRVSKEDIIVAHDDLDLELGRVKFSFDSGAAGHRGVASMIENLSSRSFYRIRMGIGRPLTKEEVESYVLSPFLREEEEKVNNMVSEAINVTKKWLQSGGKA